MQRRPATVTAAYPLTSWLPVLAAIALIAALLAPLAPRAGAQGGDSGIIDVVPGSALAYVEANLDLESEQAMQAADLFRRAGLDDIIGDTVDDEDFPTDTQIAGVVLSIPESADLDDVADVTNDPLAATESLDDGGFVGIISSDAGAEFLADERASMEQDAEDGYGTVVESEYGGIAITAFESSDEYTDSSAIAEVGDFAVFGMRAEDLHAIIDTFNGDVASLATVDEYTQLMGMLPDAYLSNGWIDGSALLEAARTAEPEAFETIDEATFAALDARTAFAFTAEPNGFRLETRSIQATAQTDAPVLLDGSFLESVPASSLLVINGTDIDGSGLLTMVAYLFASELVGEDVLATPVDQMNVEQSQDEVFARSEGLLGFNLKTDLIDNLTGEFGVALSLGDITAEIPTIDALVVSDIDNPAAVTDVMSKISFIVNAGLGGETSIDTRAVGDSNVYSIALTEEDAGIDTTIQFGVANNEELVISVGTGLDDYLEGPANPLASDEHFAELMAQLPSEYTAFTYIDVGQAIEMSTELSSSGFSMEDADPACGVFATQAEAQAVYDEDPFGNFVLDQDFDDEACEDYAYAGTPAIASPVAEADPYANIHGLASVMSEEDGVMSSTSFLLIGGE